jgi:hypothetical protein
MILRISRIFISNQFQRSLDRTRKHGAISDFDNRTLQQIRVFDYQFYNLVGQSVFRDIQFLENRFFPPQNFKRRKPCLPQQRAKFFRRQRLAKIIHSFKLDVVFTKQLRQIAARRSSRFFIDDDFLRHNFKSYHQAWFRLNSQILPKKKLSTW